MSSDIGSLVDKATSALLLDIDWDTTLQIVDLIRQGDITPKSAVNALLAKINDSNPNVVILALQVLESVVKNCGQVIHEHIATRDFMEEIRRLLKNSTNEDVQKKVILLLSAWVYAFRSEPKYRAVQDTVNILKAEGYKIPTVVESDAMFTADTAPVWADGECCHRCRSPFTMLRRKHHCRACGQVFCSDCSNKTSTIPKFGIEREVRVCDYCYEDINNSLRVGTMPKTESSSSANASKTTGTSTSPSTNPNKKSAEELQEEEELQLALALSKSEAENKEKEKLRATSNLLGGGWRQHSPTISAPPKSASPQQIVDKDAETDPEMAKYMNRSFWEQRREKIISSEPDAGVTFRGVSPTMPSAPVTATAKVSSILKSDEYLQNGSMEEVDDFVSTLRSQLEIFVNRMKSNQSRARPIANDTAVQSLFMNITAMHAQLLTYIQDQDRKRVHCEQLQDKISQIRDARAALDALREEHREKVRREKEEQERIRQIQMMQKLEIMRKKKQEYLEYQRQLALHRMAESERQILSAQHGVPPQQNVPGAPQPGFPPMGYPPQGYPPPQPQMGGYMYPAQGEGNPQPPPAQGMIPAYQGPGGAPLPPHPGYTGTQPLPTNAEFGHFNVPGSSANINMPPGYGPSHGPPIASPPGGGPPTQVQQSGDPHQIVQPQPNIHPPQPQSEEQTQLISFD